MAESSKTDKTLRLRQIMSIFSRHEILHGMTPEKLRMIVEELGPTYIKLGQIMSMRSDILPAPYCAELARLRSDVKPMEFDAVRRVVEVSLGMPLNSVFPEFDRKTLGSASIAQVHRARLADGTPVAVKVQREGIYDIMAQDVALIRRVLALLRRAPAGDVIDFSMVLDEMWSVAQEEMDFLVEARNAEHFRELNRDVNYVDCPKMFRQYSTSRVLVMEYVEGVAVNDKSKLLAAEYDLNEIGNKLAYNYLKQVIDDGFFHADPHPGNIRVRDGKIVWIDLGMVGRLGTRDQKMLGQAIKGIASHDINSVKEALLTIGEVRGHIDHVKLYSDIDDMISRYGAADLGGVDLSHVIDDLLMLCREHGVTMPHGWTMLARGIATLEGVVADICPEINVIGIAANLMHGELRGQIDWQKQLRELSAAAAASGRKSLDVPGLLSDLLRLSIRGQHKLNMELTASEDFVRTISRLLDRLIAGVVITGLLVASSLLCTTHMQPEILGIPALGVLGYFAALVLSVWLLLRASQRKNKR